MSIAIAICGFLAVCLGGYLLVRERDRSIKCIGGLIAAAGITIAIMALPIPINDKSVTNKMQVSDVTPDRKMSADVEPQIPEENDNVPNPETKDVKPPSPNIVKEEAKEQDINVQMEEIATAFMEKMRTGNPYSMLPMNKEGFKSFFGDLLHPEAEAFQFIPIMYKDIPRDLVSYEILSVRPGKINNYIVDLRAREYDAEGKEIYVKWFVDICPYGGRYYVSWWGRRV